MYITTEDIDYTDDENWYWQGEANSILIRASDEKYSPNGVFYGVVIPRYN